MAPEEAPPLLLDAAPEEAPPLLLDAAPEELEDEDDEEEAPLLLELEDDVDPDAWPEEDPEDDELDEEEDEESSEPVVVQPTMPTKQLAAAAITIRFMFMPPHIVRSWGV